MSYTVGDYAHVTVPDIVAGAATVAGDKTKFRAITVNPTAVEGGSIGHKLSKRYYDTRGC